MQKFALGPVAFLAVVALIIVAFPKSAHAVAFKVRNNSNLTLRVRVHDRGNWRPWVVCPPTFWGNVASSVKRTEHAVQVDVQTQGPNRRYRSWAPLYRGHHGSRMWTRILQVIGNPQGGTIFAWWDEPGGGCRDMPDRPGTCLKRSGWMQRDLMSLAVKAGQAYAMGQ